ncbi:hypothetical protein TWF730_007129 [Orbilia blumenaviensis]|uniref:J domain-containing protein n=1 Tax=Orbilia blumenaviensis TaxID=1796055 RepID=A0AAV9VGM8_9PEZI
MENTNDYYSLLGVSLLASSAEIRAAYKKKALETHPDKHGGAIKAKELFQAVQTAYETLQDPSKREQYDSTYVPSWGGGSAIPTPTSSMTPEETFAKKWDFHDKEKPFIDMKRDIVEMMKRSVLNEERLLSRFEQLVRSRADGAFKRDTGYSNILKYIENLRATIGAAKRRIAAEEGLIKAWDVCGEIKKAELERLKREWERGRAEKQKRQEEANTEAKQREEEERKERQRAAEAQQRTEKREEQAKKAEDRERKEAEEARRKEAPSQAHRGQGPGKEHNRQWEQSKSSRTPQNPTPCRHRGFWGRIATPWQKCSACHRPLRNCIFECPACQLRACAGCRDKMKGAGGRGS